MAFLLAVQFVSPQNAIASDGYNANPDPGFTFDGLNYGSGFGAWHGGTKTGDSTKWGTSSKPPNEFDIWNNQRGTITDSLPFNSPLAVGKTFSLWMTFCHQNLGASEGFSLLDSNGNVLFTFAMLGRNPGNNSGSITDASGTSHTGGFHYNPYSRTSYSFTLTSAKTYTFTQEGGGSHAGTLSDEAAISEIRFFKNTVGSENKTDFKFGGLAISDNASGSDFGQSASPPVPERTAPTVTLTEDQARAVVLIKGDNAEGTGFLVKTAEGPVVYTNIHVISNNPNLKITTSTGAPITIVSIKGATDRDLAMISIKDGDFKYFDLATDVASTVQPGDEVITPGNSEGGEVMLNTDGKVLGLGPDRIEFDNPIYHGNSGGPVFHVKTGKVIGIVTQAMKVDTTDALDKASFANRNSAISHSMRYFGFRIDNVPGWETYDWRRFQNETAFLDQFDLRSQCLDSFLNAPNDNKPEDNLWQKDDKIAKANSGFFEQASGADTGQQMDADRVMWGEISDLAATDMDAIQNPNNFYSFDRQRAKDEAAYRKALEAELEKINNNVSSLGSLPRTNN